MKRFKLYLVDFDGTLINSFNGLYYFYREIFKVVGHEVTKEEAFLFTKISLQEAYQRVVNNDDPELIKRFIDKCDEVVHSGVLLDLNTAYLDTIPFVNYIKDNNLLCGIVTGNDEKHIKMVLNNLHINDFYSITVCSRELEHQKPHPEGILKALEKANYTGDKKDVCYIGDAYNDALAAMRAGVTPILLNRNNEYKENEDYILIHSLIDLFDK